MPHLSTGVPAGQYEPCLSLSDALAALDGVIGRQGATFIPDDLPAVSLVPETSYADITDGYLVALAKAHGSSSRHWMTRSAAANGHPPPQ